eukprot:GDKI01031752.1.p2 GENE.GDKI01031752.1~~GDKI01031752.1.p2  ORF type:complete len:128 (-),score=74.16 GDKI01031752.1:44-427(-)
MPVEPEETYSTWVVTPAAPAPEEPMVPTLPPAEEEEGEETYTGATGETETYTPTDAPVDTTGFGTDNDEIYVTDAPDTPASDSVTDGDATTAAAAVDMTDTFTYAHGAAEAAVMGGGAGQEGETGVF